MAYARRKGWAGDLDQARALHCAAVDALVAAGVTSPQRGVNLQLIPSRDRDAIRRLRRQGIVRGDDADGIFVDLARLKAARTDSRRALQASVPFALFF